MIRENKAVVVGLLSMAISLALMAGCGGGGGGTSGGSGGITGGTPGAKVYAVGQFIELVDQGGKIVDPLNLSVGQTLTAVCVNYDPQGNRTVLGTGSFSFVTSYPGASISPSGQVSITGNPNNILTVTVGANVAGSPVTVTQNLWVAAPVGTTTVTGTLTSSNGTTPIDYVELDFYDQNKTRVGAALTMGGGKFTARTESSVYYVTITGSTIPTGYFKSLFWKGHYYALTGTSCLAHITGVGANSANPIGNLQLQLEADGPPPPPDGCGL